MTEYETAWNTYERDWRSFLDARDRYRAGEMTQSLFIERCDAFQAASRAFTAAHLKEARRRKAIKEGGHETN